MLEFMLNVFTWIVQVVVLSGLAAFGVWSTYSAIVQARRWPKVSGKIVGYNTTRSEDKPDGQKFYYAIVEFRTCEGEMMSGVSSLGSWRQPWDVGETVCVRYNPADPKRIEMTNSLSVWGVPLTCLILVVMGIAVVIYQG